MITCPKCSKPVEAWEPYRANGKLLVTWTCCSVRWQAKADFVVTEIREGWLQLVTATPAGSYP